MAMIRVLRAPWAAAVVRSPTVLRRLSSAGKSAAELGNSLIELIKAGDDDLALDLVKQEGSNVDLDLTDPYGSTALTLASRAGHLDLCRALLKQQPPPPYNAQNIFGSTALMCAAASGHPEICTELLQVPEVDVNIITQYGSTALSKAAEAGHADIVEQLMTRGANPSVSNRLGKTAAELAAAKGHVHLVEVLEAAGGRGRAAQDAPDTGGNTGQPDAGGGEKRAPANPAAPEVLVSARVCGLRAGNVVCKLDTAVQGPPGTVLAKRGDGVPQVLPVNETVLLRREPELAQGVTGKRAGPDGWVIVRVAEAKPGHEKPKKQRCLHPRRPWDKKCVDCPDKRIGR